MSAVGLSPTLVERYLAAAQKVARARASAVPLPAPGQPGRRAAASISRRKDTSTACRSARAAAPLVAHTLPARRRLRDPGSAGAQPQRERRRADRAAPDRDHARRRTAARSFTVTPNRNRFGRLLRRRRRRQAPAPARRGHRRPARGRLRHSCEKHGGAHRDRAAAVRRALQHGSASAAAAGGALGVDRRAVRRERRRATRRAATRSSCAARRRPRDGQPPARRRIMSSLRAPRLSPAGHRRGSRGAARVLRETRDAPRAVSRPASRWRCGRF